MQLLVLGTLITLGAAQQAQPPATPQTFRSGAQIVEVDVRVVKDGRFVTDLGPADFQITEDGVPQRIQSVVLVTGGAAPASSTTAPSDRPAAAPPQPTPQVWLFVIDTNHITPGPLQRTREAVVKFLSEKFRPGDIGGVVVDGKMANNRLTSDREELKQAAAAIRMPGSLRSRQLELREWPRLQDEMEAFRILNNDRDALASAVARACADDPDACRRAPPDMQVMEKARQLVEGYRRATAQTLAMINALCNGLTRLAGPKTVVFFSEGFVAQEMESQVRQAVGQAARAGAHFYSIDVRGLNKGAGSEIIDQPLAANPMGAPGGFDMQADGANSLAVDTGGFAIRNENNFGRALDEIQADAGTYYVVGYVPVNTTFDGKYRAISVSVARPGVKVRARRGYLALEPAKLLAPKPVTAPPRPPDAPVSPGLVALTGDVGAAAPAPSGGLAAGVTAVAAPETAPALRAKIDAGQMALALGKDSTDAPAQRGWAAYEKGDVATAAVHLGEAARAAGARPWVFYALGLSQFALRNYRDASTAWERVRRDVPEFETTYFNLADAYGLQHDDSAALKVLREAEKRWPADAEVANAIGVIHVRRGALDAAIESFQRATTAAPADGLGFFNLARAHQMRLLKSQRYDRQTQRWIGGDDDRRRAVENFQKYLTLGGAYERQAREALAALAWK